MWHLFSHISCLQVKIYLIEITLLQSSVQNKIVFFFKKNVIYETVTASTLRAAGSSVGDLLTDKERLPYVVRYNEI